MVRTQLFHNEDNFQPTLMTHDLKDIPRQGTSQDLQTEEWETDSTLDVDAAASVRNDAMFDTRLIRDEKTELERPRHSM